MKKVLFCVSFFVVSLFANNFEKIMTNSTLDFMMDLLSQAIFEVAKEEGLGECEDEQSKVDGCYSINKYKDGKTKQLVLYADGNVEGFFKVLHENSSEPSEKTGIIFCDLTQNNEECETFKIINGEAVENKYKGQQARTLVKKHLNENTQKSNVWRKYF